MPIILLAAALAGLLAGGCGKKSPSSATSPSDAQPAPTRATTPGEAVYLDRCAQCHMADGSGVPNMQPELIGSEIVAGDPAKLEAVIRAGSLALSDRKSKFGNEMPPFGMLSDTEMKAVMAYVRAKFGKASDSGTVK